jgi:hypothetical protein
MHLIGRAGSDPQIKKIGEKDLATFSVAYSERYKDQDQVTWFNCEVWGQLANLVSTQLNSRRGIGSPSLARSRSTSMREKLMSNSLPVRSFFYEDQR